MDGQRQQTYIPAPPPPSATQPSQSHMLSLPPPPPRHLPTQPQGVMPPPPPGPPPGPLQVLDMAHRSSQTPSCSSRTISDGSIIGLGKRYLKGFSHLPRRLQWYRQTKHTAVKRVSQSPMPTVRLHLRLMSQEVTLSVPASGFLGLMLTRGLRMRLMEPCPGAIG